jgi:hypothetical protein
LQTGDGSYGEMAEPQVDDLEAAAFGAARRSPLDTTEIGLRVVVSPNSISNTIHLQIHVDPADLMIAPRDPGYTGCLTAMAASSADGSFLQEASKSMTMDLDLTREQLDKAAREGLTIPLDLPVSDAAPKVRLIVFDRALHALGSVTVPIGAR